MRRASSQARWIPTGALTIGRGYRFSSLGAPPSLAEKLGNKLSATDRQTLDAVRLAVHKSLATGYLSIIEVEGRGGVSFRAERTTEDIWEFWMSVCRDMLEDAGMPQQWAKMVRGMGADVLVRDLKRLGLTGFLGGSKLNQLGMKYAQLGVFLRMAQTGDITDDLFQETVARRRDMPDRPWQLDER